MTKLIAWLATIIIHGLILFFLLYTPIVEIKKKSIGEEEVSYITVPHLIESSNNGMSCPKTYKGIGVIINFGSLEVSQVVKNGPADRAGVLIGDIIMDDYFQLYPVGAEINIKVVRNGQTLQLKATIDNICYE